MYNNLIQSKYMHKAAYQPTSTLFSAPFNVPTPGQYDFENTLTCQNINVLTLNPGTYYWMKDVSVGGNIPEQDYLGSIVTFPTLTVRSGRPEPVYRFPIPINKFFDHGGCDAWIYCDRGNQQLSLSLSGACIQLPSMIGIGTLSINISFSIYSINDSNFASEFRGRIC